MKKKNSEENLDKNRRTEKQQKTESNVCPNFDAEYEAYLKSKAHFFDSLFINFIDKKYLKLEAWLKHHKLDNGDLCLIEDFLKRDEFWKKQINCEDDFFKTNKDGVFFINTIAKQFALSDFVIKGDEDTYSQFIPERHLAKRLVVLLCQLYDDSSKRLALKMKVFKDLFDGKWQYFYDADEWLEKDPIVRKTERKLERYFLKDKNNYRICKYESQFLSLHRYHTSEIGECESIEECRQKCIKLGLYGKKG